MKTRFKLRITTTLFYLISNLLFLISQQALAQQDTTRVILVVRPGQNTYVKAASNGLSLTNPGSSNYTTPSAPVDTIINLNSSSLTAPKPSITTTPAIQKAKLHRHGAPTLSERAGRPTYMDPPEKNTDTSSATDAATAISAPVISTQVVAKKPGVQNQIKINDVIKKDTVYVDKRDTIYMPPKKHTSNKILFVEVGGPGLAISLNYDQRLTNSKDGWGYRVGMGYFGDGGNTVFTVPLQINYLLGSNGKYLEFGGGTTFLNTTGDNTGKTFIFDRVTGFIGTATIGLRYQPEKSMNFRLGFVPIFTDEGIIYAGGFSIGYTF